MGLIYDNNEAPQDSNTTKEPLGDTTREPLPSGQAASALKLRRRRVSDVQGTVAGPASAPEPKPHRPKLGAVLEDHGEEPQPPAVPVAGGLIDLNTLPDTQEQQADTEQPCVTDAEPALEAPQTKSGRRRLATSGPRAAVEEPPQAEPPSHGLVDVDAASEDRVPATRSGRRRMAVSEPGPQEAESAPKASRPRMSGPVSQAEVAEPKAKSHRRRLGEQETAPPSQADRSAPLDPARVQQVIAALRARQNLLLALLAGLLTAAAGAALWVMVTATTSFQLGYMALAVGFLVGAAVRFSGRGITKTFGWVGAALALLGCLLGNFLTNCVFIARETDLSVRKILEHLADNLTAGLGLMVAIHPLDLVFYGIAIYAAYRFSFRRLTEARIRRLA